MVWSSQLGQRSWFKWEHLPPCLYEHSLSHCQINILVPVKARTPWGWKQRLEKLYSKQKRVWPEVNSEVTFLLIPSFNRY